MTLPNQIIAHTRISVTAKSGETRVADGGDILVVGTDVSETEARDCLASHTASSHRTAAPDNAESKAPAKPKRIRKRKATSKPLTDAADAAEIQKRVDALPADEKTALAEASEPVRDAA